MKKREFISKVVLGSGAILTLPFLTTSCETGSEDPSPNNGGNNTGGGDNQSGELLSLDLSNPSNSALLAEGGFISKNNVIVINVDGDNYIALSSVCTHQSCQVTYSPTNNNLPCGCHGSLFSTSGAVLNGPASAPLSKYAVELEDNIITVKRS